MISMPVGSSAVLFTNKYGGDSGLAAKTIFMTTLISVFTIPLVVYMFLIYAQFKKIVATRSLNLT